VLDDGIVVAEDKDKLPGPRRAQALQAQRLVLHLRPDRRGRARAAGGRPRARHRGPYEWRTVLEPGTTPIQGPHQGGWVETPSGQGWFAHFNSTGAFGRIVHCSPWRGTTTGR
jgi:hypothetical protein